MLVTSNLDEIAAYLRAAANVLDLEQDGLGAEAADRIGDRLYARFHQEQGPDGPWPANRGWYGEEKRERSIPVGIGWYGDRIGGSMSQRPNFTGEVEVSPNEAIMYFGATDDERRKGMWFEVGSGSGGEFEPSGAANQPPRPFFQLTEDDIDDVFGLLSDRAEQRIAADSFVGAGA